MNLITNRGDIFREVKSRVNIVDVASRLQLNLKKQGSDLVGECPTGHASKSKTSFHIVTSHREPYFHCFNCGKAGDAIRLVSITKRIKDFEAVQWLIKEFNLNVDPKQFMYNQPTPVQIKEKEELISRSAVLEKIFELGKEKLYQSEGKASLDYLSNIRGYVEKILKKTEWFYLPKKSEIKKELLSHFPEMKDSLDKIKLNGYFGDNFRLAFPYRNTDGHITGFMKRSTEPKGIDTKTFDGKGHSNVRWDSTPGLKKNDLFGLDKVELKEDTLIIVEGYPDAIYLQALGMSNIVAVGQGRLTTSHLIELRRRKIKNLIIAFDNDEVGPKNTHDAVELILKNSSITPYVLDPAQYGENVKDPDEYLVKYGKDSLEKIFNHEYENGSVWIVNKLVEKYSDKSTTKIRKSEIIDEIYELCQYVNDDVIIKEIHELFCKEIMKQSISEFKKKVRSKRTIDDEIRESITKKAFVPFVDTYSATLCFYDRRNDRLKMKADEKRLENILIDNGINVPSIYPTYEVMFNPHELENKFDQHNKTFNLFSPTHYMLMERNDANIDLEVACPRIFTLIRNLIPVESERERFLNWLSYIFVKREKVDVSWVFRGDQGSGKNLFFKSIVKPLFGKNQTSVVDDDRLQNDFNSYLKNKLFIAFNEVANDESKARRSVKNKIKALVSDEEYQLHQKFMDTIEMENFVNLVFFSNEALPVLVEQKDRRFNVIETGGPLKALPSFKKNPKEFIDEINKELNKFAQYLINYKLDELAVNEVIENEAKARIKELSMNKYELFAAKLKANDWEWFDQFYPKPNKNWDLKWIKSAYMTEAELKNKKVEQGKMLMTFGECNDRYSINQGTLTKQLKINNIKKFRERREITSTYYYVWD